MQAHSSAKFINMNDIIILSVHFARAYYNQTTSKVLPTPLHMTSYLYTIWLCTSDHHSMLLCMHCSLTLILTMFYDPLVIGQARASLTLAR